MQGATHTFDQSLLDVIVKGSVNPIEAVERSALIMAATLFQQPHAALLKDEEVLRVTEFSPGLFEQPVAEIEALTTPAADAGSALQARFDA